MLTARVFNVVHGSFVDGWGVRTTVFFKGCPLRCRWCCNPESQRREPELQVIPEHCSGCGRCLSACPKRALSLENGVIRADRALCDGCGACVPVCWPGALQIWGTERGVEDVFQACLKDKGFYDASGGGVTLSGGEPTLQAEFCLDLTERLHRAGVSVAVDTCGQVMTDPGLELLRRADLVLYDVKGLDPDRHRANTGTDSRVIQANLDLLDTWGKDVIIRYPVIPHHNLDEAETIAKRLSALSCVRRVDLIPYHAYGSGKYAQLGRTYELTEDTLTPGEQEDLLALFQGQGLPVQIGG